MESEDMHAGFSEQVLDDFSSQAKWARFVSVVIFIVFLIAIIGFAYSIISKGIDEFDMQLTFGLSILFLILVFYLFVYSILFRASVSLTLYAKMGMATDFLKYTNRIKWYYILSVITSLLTLYSVFSS